MRPRSFLSALALGLLAGRSALAGGSPERTLLVVNARSPSSLQVAHAWQRLRHLPERHVLYLDGVPGEVLAGGSAISLADCQEHILGPILAYLEQQNLVPDVDTITYSTGFPYVVDLSALTQAQGWAQSPSASLTSCTYFVHALSRGGIDWLDMFANAYFRGGVPREGRSVTPKTEAEQALEEQAKQEYIEKRYAASVKTFQKLLETYRTDGNIWYNLACSQARMGLQNQALDSLERAVACGWSDSFWTRNDQDLQSVRLHPRFRDLLEVMREREPVHHPPHGYRMGSRWADRPEPAQDSAWEAARSGDGGYYLSTLLGYQGLRGNSVPEILQRLVVGAGLDGSAPVGTFYLMQHGGLRSRVRQPAYEVTLEVLAERGVSALVLGPLVEGQDGILPRGRDDVLGVLLGADELDWTGAGALVPGALVDNLTGLGAAFWSPKETKISEALRRGAAGASGSVAEPGAIPGKFASPLLFHYYTAGCSLAESWYQSVGGPYQLLLVGDPLLRPFARLGQVRFEVGEGPWQGLHSLDHQVAAPEGHPAARVEVWVDGREILSMTSGQPLPLDTNTFADGFHDVRVVAVEEGPIGTRYGAQAWVEFRNHGHAVDGQADREVVPYGAPLTLAGSASDGAVEVRAVQGARVLATAAPEDGAFSLAVDSLRLGPGTTTLRLAALYSDGQLAWSRPLECTVEPPALREGMTDEPWSLPGVKVVAESPEGERHGFAVTSLAPGCNWPLWEHWQDLGGVPDTSMVFEGELRVETAGSHEFLQHSSQPASLLVDGEPVLERTAAGPGSEHGLIGLEVGWHAVQGALRLVDPSFQYQLFQSGAEVGRHLGGAHLRWVPGPLEPVSVEPDLELLGAHASPSLRDGAREGDAQTIPSGEVTFTWTRHQRDIAAVALFVAPLEDGEAFPLEWTVEERVGNRGWKPVTGVQQTRGWDPQRGSRAQASPAWMLFEFTPMSLREFRVKPVDETTGGAVRFTEVEVLKKGRRRR